MEFIPRWRNIATRLNATALLTTGDTSPAALEEFRHTLALSTPITYMERTMSSYTKELLAPCEATFAFLRSTKQLYLAFCSCALISNVFNVPEAVYIYRDYAFNYTVSLEPRVKSPSINYKNHRGGGGGGYTNGDSSRYDRTSQPERSDRVGSHRGGHYQSTPSTTTSPTYNNSRGGRGGGNSGSRRGGGAGARRYNNEYAGALRVPVGIVSAPAIATTATPPTTVSLEKTLLQMDLVGKQSWADIVEEEMANNIE